MTRFVGVPRSVIAAAASETQGFRQIGNRMLARAIATCPVGQSDDSGDGTGEHLKDTLIVKFITGGDPRILIGSERKGDVLAYVHEGTDAHPIDPVNSSVLVFASGGETVFARHVEHPGTTANPFILEAAKSVAQENI